MSSIEKTRRDFIRQGMAAGAAAIAGPGLVAERSTPGLNQGHA